MQPVVAVAQQIDDKPGLGKALPKGAFLPVPFFCDAFVGEPLARADDKETFLAGLKARFEALRAEGSFPEWE